MGKRWRERNLDGGDQGERPDRVRSIPGQLGREVPEGHRVPGKGSRGAACPLRASGRALDSHPQLECHRAERSWRRLRGFESLAKVVEGVRFREGIEVQAEMRIRSAAATLDPVRRALPREAAEGAGPAGTGGKNAQAEGLTNASDEAFLAGERPSWAHRRGKRPAVERRPPISQVKRTAEGIPGAASVALVRRLPSPSPAKEPCPPLICRRHRCTLCTLNWARRWCRSPVTTCR